ncbi:MAG: hypothetical protein EOP91_08260 [Lysobacteraceae bacterium]|nr:MAG: hypothetical protein EOP91_08260 [Xanthomonadaceae bacterium]
MNGATGHSLQPGWWKRNRAWLAGSLVLGALAFYLPWRDSQAERARSAPSHRIDAAGKGWSQYEGSDWRIAGVEFEPGAGKAVADYPHAPGSLLLVHYQVKPGPAATAKLLDRCRGRLVDATGRRWPANEPYKLGRRLRDRGFNDSCGTRPGESFVRVEARPGQAFDFSHAFLLPPGTRPEGLRAELFFPPSTTTPHGSYLSFPLPPAAP